MDIYRGYEIAATEGKDGYVWTDERNFTHYYEGVSKTPYSSVEAAMNDIDAYRRKLRAQSNNSN